MVQKITIQGVGDVEFPDNMTQDQIAHAIETELLPSLNKGTTTEGGASTGVFPQMTGKRQLQDTERSANMPQALAESALAGLLSAPASIAQFANIHTPADIVQRLKQHASDISYPAVSTAGSLAGEGVTVGPLAMKAYQMASKIPNVLGKSELFKSGVGALTSGLLTPTKPTDTYGEFLEEKVPATLATTAVGSALGKGTQMLMNPKITPEMQKMIDMGIKEFTPGQLAGQIPFIGKALQNTEKLATSMPLAGMFIRSELEAVNKNMNKAVANEALKHIGEQLPKDVKAGTEMMSFLNNKVNNSYTDIANKIDFTPKPNTLSNLASVEVNALRGLHPDKKEEFASIIKDNFYTPLLKGNYKLSGQQFRDAESDLGTIANDLRGSREAQDRRLGKAVRAFQEGLRDELANVNPAHAKELKGIHEFFKRYLRIEDSARKLGAENSVFTPSQFASSTHKMGTNAQQASRTGLMEPQAETIKNVLGPTLPDSFSAQRLMTGQGFGKLVGGSAVEGLGHTLTGMGMPLALTGAMYNPVSRKLLSNVVTAPRPQWAKNAQPAVSSGLSALGGINQAQPQLDVPEGQ
jgi:hypothetical protein